MDKHLNKIEEKIQELMLQFDFNDLSPQNKAFVLEHSSQYDYQLERSVILQASSLFDDETKAVPLPLQIEDKSRKGFATPVPLYQSVAIAAAAACLVYFFFPQTEIIQRTPETKTEYITKIDTVTKTIHKTDTVFQPVEKPIYIEKKVFINQAVASSTETPVQKEPQLLNTPTQNNLTLNPKELSNKGVSLKNDPTSSLLEGLKFGE